MVHTERAEHISIEAVELNLVGVEMPFEAQWVP